MHNNYNKCWKLRKLETYLRIYICGWGESQKRLGETLGECFCNFLIIFYLWNLDSFTAKKYMVRELRGRRGAKNCQIIDILRILQLYLFINNWKLQKKLHVPLINDNKLARLVCLSIRMFVCMSCILHLNNTTKLSNKKSKFNRWSL